MKPYRLRNDLTREQLGDFALPLGIRPVDLTPPQQGYTVTYSPADENSPDSYSFHVVVSHDRLRDVIHKAFGLLSEQVFGIIEIGSRDAYRSTDVYVSEEPMDLAAFLETWMLYEDFLVEDGGIGAGANCEEPFIEVFVDQWKGVALHVPLSERERVERMLWDFDLEEVSQTWSDEAADPLRTNASELRSVLDLTDDYAPDVDELLLQLRHAWNLLPDIDPETNKDERGRELGLTLWHVVLIAQSKLDDDAGAYISVWATASSANEVGRLVDEAMHKQPDWELIDVYSFDRIAFDDRPDELADLPPRSAEPGTHLVEVEPWTSAPAAER